MWSRRRWSSSSFSRDGTPWAPRVAASSPSFAAGGLASLGLGATFALAGAASADASDPSAPQTAFGADVRVSSAALRDVSRDVADGPPRARRRALRLLSKITLYIDHHDAVLAVPEVRSALLEALRLGDAVDDQSRALVLGCLADLAKHPEIRAATILRRETLEALADAATPRRWRSSPPILARRAVSDAMRLIAELAADDATHETLVASGVVDALARHGRDLAMVPGVGDDEPRRETRRRAQTTRARGRRRRRGKRRERRVERRRRVGGVRERQKGDVAGRLRRVDVAVRDVRRARSRRRETRVRGVVRTRRVERGPRRHRRVRGDANGGVARAFAKRSRSAPVRRGRGGAIRGGGKREVYDGVNDGDAQDGDAQGGDEGPRLRGRTGGVLRHGGDARGV